MIVKTKLMKELGYRGSGAFKDASSHSIYYKPMPKDRCIVGLSNLSPPCIFVFRLTPDQYSQFEHGKLSLIPPGCCNPSGGNSLENPIILHTGDFVSTHQVKTLLALTEDTVKAKPKDSSTTVNLTVTSPTGEKWILPDMSNVSPFDFVNWGRSNNLPAKIVAPLIVEVMVENPDKPLNRPLSRSDPSGWSVTLTITPK